MHRCQQLHETIIRDVVDVINDVKNFDQIEWLTRKNNTGSIAKRASNLVLVFPVLCSSSLSMQSAITISKAIERKCVNLLQILFSSYQFTGNSQNDLMSYINQFHTNLNTKSLNFDEFIDLMDAMEESGQIEITDREAYEMVMEDMKNINYYLSEIMNEVSLNDYEYRTDIYGTSSVVLKEANGRENKLNEARNLDKSDLFRHQLLPQDAEKANELTPTIVMVRFNAVGDNGDSIPVTGIVGVKAKLYPVDPMEIVNRISTKYTDSNTLFNLVRASTREISFFKDLAFAIDKAKLDAINMAKESNNAKMFKILERRAAKNRFSSLLRKNDASPITSLVISQDEVEYLRKYNNLDMEKSYVTRSIMEAYNLMDIVIADESLEVAKFLYDDGDGIFETLPFDALEKESKDNSYKKVINLLSKVNR